MSPTAQEFTGVRASVRPCVTWSMYVGMENRVWLTFISLILPISKRLSFQSNEQAGPVPGLCEVESVLGTKIDKWPHRYT